MSAPAAGGPVLIQGDPAGAGGSCSPTPHADRSPCSCRNSGNSLEQHRHPEVAGAAARAAVEYRAQRRLGAHRDAGGALVQDGELGAVVQEAPEAEALLLPQAELGAPVQGGPQAPRHLRQVLQVHTPQQRPQLPLGDDVPLPLCRRGPTAMRAGRQHGRDGRSR